MPRTANTEPMPLNSATTARPSGSPVIRFTGNWTTWPTTVNGETVSTMPGTLMALIQPKPRPDATEIPAKTATASPNDANALAAAIAVGLGFHEVQGVTRNGSATATRNAGCLTAAATPTTSAPPHHAR